MNILLSGFEPFQQDTSNPSWEIAHALDGWQIAEHVVHAIKLPVVFGESAKQLFEAIEYYQPSVVICLGLAANRTCISLERIAINLDDAPIPDNAGDQPIDEPIISTAPIAYFSTLALKNIFQALKHQDIPVEISNSAGTYVCNHIFYQLMHFLAKSQRTVHAGFIHVPSFDNMNLDKQISAIRLVLHSVLSEKISQKISAGKIS